MKRLILLSLLGIVLLLSGCIEQPTTTTTVKPTTTSSVLTTSIETTIRETTTIKEIKYFCNHEEFNDWLKEMVYFEAESNGTIIYPDSFDYDTQIPIEDIRQRAWSACVNRKRITPSGIYTSKTTFNWGTARTFIRGVCIVNKKDGSHFSAWGFQLKDKKYLVPDAPRKTINDKTYYRTGFIFEDTGLCFKWIE